MSENATVEMPVVCPICGSSIGKVKHEQVEGVAPVAVYGPACSRCRPERPGPDE